MRRIRIRIPGIDVSIAGPVAAGRVFGLNLERVGPCVAITSGGRTRGFLLPGTKRA